MGFSSRFDYITQDTKGNIYGIDSLELFGRYKFYDEGGYVLSVQPLVQLPNLFSRNNKALAADDQLDFELRALGGYGFEYEGASHFIDVEAAYRRRIYSTSDQLLFDTTLGMRPPGYPEFMILSQIFSTFSTKSIAAAIPFTNANDNNYYLVKGQISLVYSMDEKISFQVGGFSNLWGKNSGAGEGIIVSIWYNF